jgi:Protein of unknown function (DUF3106)
LAQAARFAVALAAALALLASATQVGAAPEKDRRWAELGAERQGILAPLSAEWNRLEPAQRVTWLGVAKRYPKMTPIGQKRVQTKMKKWVKLTPEQRKLARENYRRISKVAPGKRGDLKQQWDEYQSQPPHKAPAK